MQELFLYCFDMLWFHFKAITFYSYTYYVYFVALYYFVLC